MRRLRVHLGFPRRLTREKVLEVLSLPFQLENSFSLLFSLSFGELFQAFLPLRLSFVVAFSFASFSFVRLSSVRFSSTSLFSSFRLVLSPFALTFLRLLLLFFPRVKAVLPRLVSYVVFCPTIGAKHGGEELGRGGVVLLDFPSPIPLPLALSFASSTFSTATTATTTVAVCVSLCLLERHEALLT